MDLVSFDLQFDLPFSGAVTTGTVRLLLSDSGSKETEDVDCRRDSFGPPASRPSPDGRDVSPDEVEGL